MPDLPELRLLAEAYDNATQPRFVDWDAGNFVGFLGRLRLDALLYDKVIFKDGDVFYGNLFLAAAAVPNGLAEIPWEKIEIRSRAKTLNDTILQSIKGDRRLKPTLLGFLPKRYSATRLADISDGLAKHHSRHVKTFHDVIRAFSEVGVDFDDAEKLRAAWALLDEQWHQWPLAEWDTERPFAFLEEARKDQASVANAIISPAGKDLFTAISQPETLNNRNMVYSYLATAEEAARGTSNEQEIADVHTMRTWYKMSYKAAQEYQHHCNSMEIIVEPLCRPFGSGIDLGIAPSRRPKRDDPIEVIEIFLENLGRMPREDVARVYEISHPIMKDVRDWHLNSGKDSAAARDSLHRAIENLVRLTEQYPVSRPSPTANTEQWVNRTGKTLVAGVVVGTAAILERAFKERDDLTILSRRTFLRNAGLGGVAYAIGDMVPDVGEYIPGLNYPSQVARVVCRTMLNRTSAITP